jgi:hypothetical protein
VFPFKNDKAHHRCESFVEVKQLRPSQASAVSQQWLASEVSRTQIQFSAFQTLHHRQRGIAARKKQPAFIHPVAGGAAEASKGHDTFFDDNDKAPSFHGFLFFNFFYRIFRVKEFRASRLRGFKILSV